MAALASAHDPCHAERIRPVLPGEADARAHRAGLPAYVATPDPGGAAVGGEQGAEDAYAGGLARAVRPQQPKHGAAFGPPPPAETCQEGWRAAVHAWVRAALDVYAEHPWLLRVAANTPPIGPNQLGWLDTLLHHIWEVGLDQEEMIHLATFLSGAVRDLTRLSTELAESPQRTGVPIETMGEEYAEAMKRVTDDVRFPTLSRMVAADMFEPSGTAYNDIRPSLDFGIQLLLDGVNGYVSARAR